MNSELNERIELAQLGITRLKKIDIMLTQLESEQKHLCARESELGAMVDKEDEDVRKLENSSLGSFFYSMLGTFEDHVEKERREALAARLKFDQVQKDLADVQNQISRLSAERLDYLRCQEEFDELYAQKKTDLIRENGETAQKILRLADTANQAKMSLGEIHEATVAGEEVLAGLERVHSSLNSAEGWGAWDLLGGGFIAGLAKHSHIDDAKAEAENTQRYLRRFRTELADIQLDSDIDIQTDGFGKFADFFFDGLIADWFMQSKIQESQASVKRVKKEVLLILERLEQWKEQQNSIAQRIEIEIKNLIVQA